MILYIYISYIYIYRHHVSSDQPRLVCSRSSSRSWVAAGCRCAGRAWPDMPPPQAGRQQARALVG